MTVVQIVNTKGATEPGLTMSRGQVQAVESRYRRGACELDRYKKPNEVLRSRGPEGGFGRRVQEDWKKAF